MGPLLKFLDSPGRTLLCVAPLSRNIVEASINFSQKQKFPILFVASRQQLDGREFGGGYLNHWDTSTFAEKYRPEPDSLFWLGRDHGGPWQGSFERRKEMGARESMEVAKRSFEVDIESGFTFLHLDPSLPVGNEELDESVIWERLQELYSHVVLHARKLGREIVLEVGTEEQNGLGPDVAKFESFLSNLKAFTTRNDFPMPLFVVLQTGTKVSDLKNVGVFERSPEQRAALEEKIRACAAIARSYGCYVKEHNTDYLSDSLLALRSQIGIKGANVGPELGETETRHFVALLRDFGMDQELAAFTRIVLESQRWKKWFSSSPPASDEEKLLAAGHYSFAHPEVVRIKKALSDRLASQGEDLDEILRGKITNSLSRFAQAFGIMQ